MPVVLGAASAFTSRRVALYGIASTLAASGVVLNAFRQRSNFYAAAVMLGGSNGCMMVLFNFGIFLTLCFGAICQKIFFGPLRAIEVEHLHERLWYAITESLLAMTIFRDDFDSSFALLFGTMLFLKVFHWLSADRVEYMEQSPSVSRLFHVRMIAVLSILFELDLFLATFAVEVLIIDRNRKGIMIMFASEFFILGATLWSIIAKYLINCQDSRSEEPWQAKSMYVFVVDLITDFLKLATYLACFCLILSYYGLPLHIFRDVYMTGRSFFGRLRDFVKYRAATRNMDTRFPNASVADLQNMTDGTCIICREEMVAIDENGDETEPGQSSEAARPSNSGLNETPKKLPCGHIFHFHCLRSWLERQQSCPTCRRTVFALADQNVQSGRESPQNGQAQRGAADREGAGEGRDQAIAQTDSAPRRLRDFMQHLQTDEQRTAEERSTDRRQSTEAGHSTRLNSSSASRSRDTAIGTTSGTETRHASTTVNDAALTNTRRVLINSLFAHQEPGHRRRQGESSGSVLPPAPLQQGVRPLRSSDKNEDLDVSWISPAPWTLRREIAKAQNKSTKEASTSTGKSPLSGQEQSGTKEEKTTSSVVAEAPTDPQDAREAAQAAALRRFEAKKLDPSSKTSTSQPESFKPSLEAPEKASLPGNPHLIPLFDVSSIKDFDNHYAPQLSFPLLNRNEAKSFSADTSRNEAEQLVSLALSSADLELLSRQTRKGLEERLRLLYRVEESVGQLVEELTRALSVLPADDRLQEETDAVTSASKGKEPAEGIHAPPEGGS